MGGASLVFGLLTLFIATEKTFVHLSRNARRIFWYLFSCALTVWIIRWVGSLEGLSLAWVLLSATLAASVVEDEVSKKLGLTMMNIEATQHLRAQLRTPEAQGKAERVMDIVSSISRGRGYTLGAKQLVGRMSGTTARLQRTLHKVLEQAAADELNYMLCTINCPAMVEVCSRDTMDLLCHQRMAELATVTRAVIVDALQKLGLRYRPRRQLWARDVLLATRGLQLTYLKCYLDDGGDFHSTYKLMSHDLQGSTQQAVAEHLKAEGQLVAAEFRQFSSSPGVMLKVVSDIDDTLFSSGGSWPAGIDNRYPKKCYYPGALTLYTELDRCFAEKHNRALQRLAEAEAAEVAGASTDVTPTHAGTAAGPAAVGPFGSLANIEEEEPVGAGDHGRPPHSPSPPIPMHPGTGHATPLSPTPSEQSPPPAGSRATTPWPLAGSGARGLDDSAPLSTQTSSSTLPEASSVGGSLWGDSSAAMNGGATATGGGGGSTLKATRSALTSSLTSRLRPLHVPRPGLAPASPPPEPGTAGSGSAAAAHAAGAGTRGNASHQEGSNLVFLSARPESYKGLTEAEAYSKYFSPLVGRELRTAPSMLTGSLSSGPKALLHYVLGWQPMEVADNPRTASTALFQTLAAKKLSRFRDFAAAWPECCFLFIGDNGQGDVLCAEVLWSSMRQQAASTGGSPDKSRLLACLIHKVAPTAATYSMLRSKAGNKATWVTAWKQRNIHMARSHVGIATQAFTLGLLDVAGLHRVCAAAVMDFRRIWARYAGRHAGRHLGRALEHLQADLRSASFYLPPDQPLPPLLLTEVVGGGGVGGGGSGAAPPPPPSPARSVLGSSPKYGREYGYLDHIAEAQR